MSMTCRCNAGQWKKSCTIHRLLRGVLRCRHDFVFLFASFFFGGFWQPELQNSRVYILNPSQKRDRVPKKPRGEGEGIAESFSWLETNRSFGCERGEVSSLYLFSSLRCVCAERLAKKRMNSGALFRNHVPPLSSVPWVHERRESVNRAVYCHT